jgi:hypothetical protein
VKRRSIDGVTTSSAFSFSAVPLRVRQTTVSGSPAALPRTTAEKQLPVTTDAAGLADLNATINASKDKVKGIETQIKEPRATMAAANLSISESNIFRVMFFLLTFFTIGLVSNFKKLWEEGIGKLAAVYVLCLFGFIIWVGLVISWIFFHGVKPPIITG